MTDAMIDTAAAGLPYLVFGMILGFLFACLAFVIVLDSFGRGRGDGGSSVLLIEGAEKLLQDGIPQRDILLIAGDIDGRACDISYVQLSLLGYAAVVQHMDALAQRRISPDSYTPGWYLHCMPMRRVAS